MVQARLFHLAESAIDLSCRVARERDVHPRVRRSLILSRILFLVAIALVIAGGCLNGKYQNPQDVSTGIKLVKAGYIVLAFFVGCLVAFQIYFWARYSQLLERSRKVSSIEHTQSRNFLGIDFGLLPSGAESHVLSNAFYHRPPSLLFPRSVRIVQPKMEHPGWFNCPILADGIAHGVCSRLHLSHYRVPDLGMEGRGRDARYQ